MTRLNGKPIRILQITDTHLGKDEDETLLGLRTADSLADVLERAKEIKELEGHFDLVLSSGDISNDGTPGSYDRFVRAVRKTIPNTPIAWLDGNHDDPASMRAIQSSAPITGHLMLGGWQIILLSSRVPYEERGELPESELLRLESLLQAEPVAPTLIFLHHQLIPVGSAWIDQYVVSNSKAFFSITDRFDNIKAISWGHVHQEFHRVRKGVDLIATPSTCVQFKPNCDDFMVDNVMPGFRIYDLMPNGSYASEVCRVSERAYNIDYASSGY